MMFNSYAVPFWKTIFVSVLRRVQTGFEAYPASNLMDAEGSFPGGKAVGA
jgi:hypothetical protein